MSMFFGGTAQGPGRASQLSQTGSRSDVLGRQYQAFSNPFFDLASTYTPPTIKALFGFCRFFHLTHGIIHAVNTKAAEYPVTDLLLSHKDAGVQRRWEELMHGVLNYRTHQVEINLDYSIYGNAFVSPSYPFTKYLKCKCCGAETEATKSRANWRYNNHGFWLSCAKCGQTDWASATDRYYPRLGDINLQRWNPEFISMFTNEATGRCDYTLDFSAEFRNGITMGRKDLVATTPNAILDAVRLQRTIVFDSNSVFHLRRPGPSQMMHRWGVPLMMPILKDAYYMQIMKKAQEAVLLQHLVPQIFLFPQPATAGADPFTTTNLVDWRDHIRRELARQRMDPSYYGILPFPLGHQVIGENGKSLMLMPEIQSMAEHIVVGMGFPVDLIFGNGTYAGSSVNMRMLENSFMGNINAHMRLVHWVIKHFATFLGLPRCDARFKAFRMADDTQRMQLLLQANQGGLVSQTSMLSQMDLKPEDEAELQLKELTINAELMRRRGEMQASIQGRQAVIMAKEQARAQVTGQNTMALETMSKKSPFDQAVQSGVGGPQGVTLDAVAAALAKEVAAMPPERAAVWLRQLRSAVPEMAELVAEQQGAGLPAVPGDPAAGGAPQGGSSQPPGAPGAVGPISMLPMPEVLPPRRPGGV
jgi:hypothetical protein